MGLVVLGCLDSPPLLLEAAAVPPLGAVAAFPFPRTAPVAIAAAGLGAGCVAVWSPADLSFDEAGTLDPVYVSFVEAGALETCLVVPAD